MLAAKLVHELLPERGAALFERLGADAQRAARGPVAKSPAALRAATDGSISVGGAALATQLLRAVLLDELGHFPDELE